MGYLQLLVTAFKTDLVHCFVCQRSTCSDKQHEQTEWHQWPDVLYADIYNYLIETTSKYTREKLKASVPCSTRQSRSTTLDILSVTSISGSNTCGLSLR